MKKVERLIALLYLLKRRHGMRTKDIARELGTTERTVYRDIVSLNEAFQDYVQIIYTHEGYKLDRTIYAPPLRLIQTEIEAIDVAINALLETHPQSQLARQALSKIKSTFYDTDRVNLADLDQTLNVMSPVPKDKVAAKTLNDLEVAIKNQTQIKIKYFSHHSQKEKEYLVNPYGLVFRKHAWYLIGFVPNKDKVINFRAVRIKEIQPSNQTFERPENFSFQEVFSNSWMSYGGQPETVQLQFSTPTSYLIEELEWNDSQKTEVLENGDVELEMKVSINPELIGWVLSWGSDCKVIEPLSLREKVKAEVFAMYRQYDEK